MFKFAHIFLFIFTDSYCIIYRGQKVGPDTLALGQGNVKIPTSKLLVKLAWENLLGKLKNLVGYGKFSSLYFISLIILAVALPLFL